MGDSVLARIASSLHRTGPGAYCVRGSLDQLFAALDTDGNGLLTRPEMDRLFVAFEPSLTDTDLKSLFTQCDRDGSGAVDIRELRQSFDEALCLLQGGMEYKPVEIALPEHCTLPENWTQHTDPATGKTVYYNALTKETTCSKPLAPPPATHVPPVSQSDTSPLLQIAQASRDYAGPTVHSWVLGDAQEPVDQGAMGKPQALQRELSMTSKAALETVIGTSREVAALEKKIYSIEEQHQSGLLSDGDAKTRMALLEKEVEGLQSRLDDIHTGELSEYGRRQVKQTKADLLRRWGISSSMWHLSRAQNHRSNFC
mmetsp:Transcript_100466/g.174369  ORF Transcript_100466/g.174369 Transcript_100466/m.174369 type:complete len:313 (-) Transcript_100466:75-1013(-)